MTKKWFRVFGVLLIVLGAYCRLNARMVVGSGYSFSGEFQLAPFYQLLTGFADLMNIMVVSGAAMVILSFTTLIKPDE
jgi:hypothetical protein